MDVPRAEGPSPRLVHRVARRALGRGARRVVNEHVTRVAVPERVVMWTRPRDVEWSRRGFRNEPEMLEPFFVVGTLISHVDVTP